ncbi:MAG: hypothetical protein O2845_04750 [Proteobacteria bacterium]|nr:hypothetical protein [Pseudomonadota bacterium]
MTLGKSHTLGVNVAFLATKAEASTGLPYYFGWLVLSMYAFIPVLLLVPVVGIARMKLLKQENKALWVLSAVTVGILSYISLWWAANKFTLGATEAWPVIFLWLLPSYLLWFVLTRRVKHSRAG